MVSRYQRLFEGISPINPSHFHSNFKNDLRPRQEQPKKKNIITMQDAWDAHELHKQGVPKEFIQSRMNLSDAQMKMIFKESVSESDLDTIRDGSITSFESPFALGEEVGIQMGENIIPAEVIAIKFEPERICYDLLVGDSILEDVCGSNLCSG